MGKHFYAGFTLAVQNVMPVRIVFSLFFLIPYLQQLLAICQLLLNLVKGIYKADFWNKQTFRKEQKSSQCVEFSCCWD